MGSVLCINFPFEIRFFSSRNIHSRNVIKSIKMYSTYFPYHFQWMMAVCNASYVSCVYIYILSKFILDVFFFAVLFCCVQFCSSNNSTITIVECDSIHTHSERDMNQPLNEQGKALCNFKKSAMLELVHFFPYRIARCSYRLIKFSKLKLLHIVVDTVNAKASTTRK